MEHEGYIFLTLPQCRRRPPPPRSDWISWSAEAHGPLQKFDLLVGRARASVHPLSKKRAVRDKYRPTEMSHFKRSWRSSSPLVLEKVES